MFNVGVFIKSLLSKKLLFKDKNVIGIVNINLFSDIIHKEIY